MYSHYPGCWFARNDRYLSWAGSYKGTKSSNEVGTQTDSGNRTDFDWLRSCGSYNNVHSPQSIDHPLRKPSPSLLLVWCCM